LSYTSREKIIGRNQSAGTGHYLKQMVADSLGIDEKIVLIDDQFSDTTGDSGPALLSRGVSLVPRAIVSACDAIRSQGFRKPLPIEVSRTIRIPRSKRTPVDQGVSYAAASVEVMFHPASLEVDIRTIHMAVNAGRIIDRPSAERELRRGIYQALSWTLHEAVTSDADAGELSESGLYDTRFRGRLPRIRITFVGNEVKESPGGIGELPFSTVPAATITALNQATGVDLTRIPVSMDDILSAMGNP